MSKWHELDAFWWVIQLAFLGSQVYAIPTTIDEVMVHLPLDEVEFQIYGYIKQFFHFASYYERSKTFEFRVIALVQC